MVNTPPGISTSAGSGPALAAGGSGACSTGGPDRSWWVASMVSSCCCSCWAIMPNAKPWSTSRWPDRALAASTSSALSRTWRT